MTANFDGAKLFLMIPAKIAHDHRLKPTSRLIFGEIFAMLNTTGHFYMSNATLSEKLGLSVNTLHACLKELEEYGYIARKVVRDESKQVIGREITSPLTTNFRDTPKNYNEGSSQKQGGGHPKKLVDPHPQNCDLPHPKNWEVKRLSLREHSKKSGKYKLSGKPDSARSDAEGARKKQLTNEVNEVLEYLVKKTGKKLNIRADSNRDTLRSRLKDGYTVEQCKQIIDNKFEDWHNKKFSNGRLGDDYLVPKTLFRPLHFERYLHERHGPIKNGGFDDKMMADPSKVSEDELPEGF